MQPSATLLEYLTIADIAVFLGTPLCLLAIVFVQQLLAGRTTPPFGGSYPRRPAQPSLLKGPEAWSPPHPRRPAPGK